MARHALQPADHDDVRARDALFEDADRHGPRSAALAWRIVPALIAIPIAVALATLDAIRRPMVEHLSASMGDLVLVLPFVAAVVALAAAFAPLARVRASPLIVVGASLLGVGAWLVQSGQVVAATIPSTVGALLVGVASARAIRRAVWALPLLLAAGVSDAHSVAYGVTGRLIGDDAAVGVAHVAAVTSVPVSSIADVDLLVVHVPVLTGVWLLGLVDVVAIGLLLGLSHLFWLPLGRSAAAIFAAIVVAMAVGGAVPVLPLLGAAWLAANARLIWRSTRFSLRRLTYLGG